MQRACATQILIGPHVWSWQNDFSLSLFIFFSSVQYDTNNNSAYIKYSFSIGYFERYVNSKSVYLELFLSVYVFREKSIVSEISRFPTPHATIFQLYATQKKFRITYYIIFALAILNPCSYFERDGNCTKLAQHYQWAYGNTSTNFQDDLTFILEKLQNPRFSQNFEIG